MIGKVTVHYPEDMNILTEILEDTLAKILVKKLSPKEIDKFIELLEDPNVELKL